ncbi:HAD family hydrolase [Bacillus sp. 2205SS5-2]|uniref:HAD family hydrolase n=1 Tax=Bacillus sp. 2205SS5-2 TaxID=3109031 RepID=UPI003003CA90
MAIVTVDFDGTLYQGNSFKTMFQIGKKRFKTKQWTVVAGGLVKASALGVVKGKNTFRHEFFKAFAKTFKGKTNAELEDFFQELVNFGRDDIHHNLVRKIREHQKNGDTVILLSGALQPFLKAFTKDLKLDAHVISTELLFTKNGHCKGELGQIINGEVKVEKLTKWIKEQQYVSEETTEEIWAYADSESDIPLLNHVTHPIVVNPKEDMMKIAEQNKWSIFAS